MTTSSDPLSSTMYWDGEAPPIQDREALPKKLRKSPGPLTRDTHYGKTKSKEPNTTDRASVLVSRGRERAMARPPAKELTERELEVMHLFWSRGESTIAEARDSLAESGLDRAYTTVATLVRILLEKGFLKQTNGERPFRHVAARSYEEVSRRLLGEVLDRVFRGSREQLLVRLMEQRSLTAKERARLREILGRDEP